MKVYWDNGGGGIQPNYLSIVLNWETWYQIEFEVQLSDPGASNGFYNLYVNGTRVANRNNISNRASQFTAGINDIEIGNQVNRFNASNVNEYRYWDDVIILKK